MLWAGIRGVAATSSLEDALVLVVLIVLVVVIPAEINGGIGTTFERILAQRPPMLTIHPDENDAGDQLLPALAPALFARRYVGLGPVLAGWSSVSWWSSPDLRPLRGHGRRGRRRPGAQPARRGHRRPDRAPPRWRVGRVDAGGAGDGDERVTAPRPGLSARRRGSA